MEPRTGNNANKSLFMATLRDLAIVGGVVFAASLLGILSRPTGLLAVFWPANAILLGLFVRMPHLATGRGWLVAALGYLAADLVTGSSTLNSLWLAAANLTGVAVGSFLYQRIDPEHRTLSRPLSVLYMLAICAASAAAGSVIGSEVGPAFMEQGRLIGAAFWFTTELAHSIIVLPLILIMPPLSRLLGCLHAGWRLRRGSVQRMAPFLALVASILIGVVLGGPGALAFPIPALLWCALTYGLFTTVLLTLATTIFKLITVTVTTGVAQHPLPEEFILSVLSLRLGIVFVALSPLTVASINQVRKHMLQRLDYAANHDSLTGALVRRAFMAQSAWLMTQFERYPRGLAVLMVDIDHFKRINDEYGHSVGDDALSGLSHAVMQRLREGDLFGRLGGEEFGVIMPNLTADEASKAAERLREQVSQVEVVCADGAPLRMTISIGLAMHYPGDSHALSDLLAEADQALYRAKADGRDRVSLAWLLENQPGFSG